MNDVAVLKRICVFRDLHFKIYSGFYTAQEILGLKYGLLLDAFCKVPSRQGFGVLSRRVSIPQKKEDSFVLPKSISLA